MGAPKVAQVLASWPLVRQLREGDPRGVGKAVQSGRSAGLKPRLDEAERVVGSICPYCAVGCGQLCLRWSVFRAGFQSARDPKYTVEPQRRRVEAARH